MTTFLLWVATCHQRLARFFYDLAAQSFLSPAERRLIRAKARLARAEEALAIITEEVIRERAERYSNH